MASGLAQPLGWCSVPTQSSWRTQFRACESFWWRQWLCRLDDESNNLIAVRRLSMVAEDVSGNTVFARCLPRFSSQLLQERNCGIRIGDLKYQLLITLMVE